MPIGVIAKLSIQPDKARAFEIAFIQFQQTVISQEPGNIFFQLHRSREQQGFYSILEQYVDQAALDLHQSSEYYKAIPDTFGDFMAGPPDIEYLDSVA